MLGIFFPPSIWWEFRPKGESWDAKSRHLFIELVSHREISSASKRAPLSIPPHTSITNQKFIILKTCAFQMPLIVWWLRFVRHANTVRNREKSTQLLLSMCEMWRQNGLMAEAVTTTLTLTPATVWMTVDTFYIKWALLLGGWLTGRWWEGGSHW